MRWEMTTRPATSRKEVNIPQAVKEFRSAALDGASLFKCDRDGNSWEDFSRLARHPELHPMCLIVHTGLDDGIQR